MAIEHGLQMGVALTTYYITGMILQVCARIPSTKNAW